MAKSRSLLACGIAVVAVVCAWESQATTYNLAADWSDAQNPNGVWSLYKNATDLFAINQSDFSSDGSMQHAWADQPCFLNAHVPVWLKSKSSGVINAHGSEFDRTGANVTFVRWTCPSDGYATISGSIWTVSLYKRTMGWNLLHNGSAITGGTVYSDGAQDADHPVLFSAGNGGAEVLSFGVKKGDAVDLLLTSISEGGNLGDSVGLSLAIDSVAIEPLPPSLRIARVTGGVLLQWPATASGYVLETASEFLSNTQWAAVANVPSLSDTNLQVLLPLTDSAAYFRLKK